MEYKRIVLLAGQWDTTPVVYQFLKRHFSVEKAVIEEPVPRKEFLKRRIKKLGYLEVAGQVLFQLAIAKPLKKTSAKRIREIHEQYGLSTAPIPPEDIIAVPSVNADACLEILKRLQPDLVIVHGTRIISKKLLRGLSCTFVNIHAGITPRYRGSHGAYWALASSDAAHCGVTVHLIDEGIDTGNILAQATITPAPADNFSTYGYLQLAVGLELLKQAIPDLAAGKQPARETALNSTLWHHPTFWGYLYKRLTKGVR
ncbi:MAG: formyl transferase [Flaviaesturariibacter sp.]|nr:formyl transferase [Flaviaesturariibacter sp.]